MTWEWHADLARQFLMRSRQKSDTRPMHDFANFGDARRARSDAPHLRHSFVRLLVGIRLISCAGFPKLAAPSFLCLFD